MGYSGERQGSKLFLYITGPVFTVSSFCRIRGRQSALRLLWTHYHINVRKSVESRSNQTRVTRQLLFLHTFHTTL